MHGLPLLEFVAVALLILANAFFVAAEFALVSIRETRIEQMIAAGVPGARSVRRLQHELDDFLPAVQLGVTLCSLALGWIGEPLAAGIFLGWLHLLPQPPVHAVAVAHAAALVAVALGFATITYFHVLIGEIVPKSLALRRAEALAVAVAPAMLAFMALARPAVRLLRSSAAVVLRGFDVPMNERAQVHSPEELKLIATAARRMGLLPLFQEQLIHRALELDEVPVREIMTPRQKIVSLPSSMSIEAASAQVIENQHSRIPVYDEARGPEHIIGVVYSKDLARLIFFRPQSQRISIQTQDMGAPGPSHLGTRETEKPGGPGLAFETRETTKLGAPSIRRSSGEWMGDHEAQGAPGPSHLGTRETEKPRISVPYLELKLHQIMRDILVVPETKTVLDLIRDLQQRRRQMAIVVDEYGSTVGLVTVEDAIEQLTGELEDEFDSPTFPAVPTSSGALLLDGGVNLRDLETQTQWSLPREGGVETLAGFLLMRLGHIPRTGESVTHEGRKLTVAEMEGRRISKVRVEPAGEELQNSAEKL